MPEPANPNQIPPASEKSVGELVFDVSERTSSLIREEIALAKAEVGEKLGKIARGSVSALIAGVFAFLALILVMEGIAWLLNEKVFEGKTWPGFFVEAAAFLLLAAAGGYAAYRGLQAGTPPVPEQAIEEAKLTRATLGGETETEHGAPQSGETQPEAKEGEAQK
jgi:hypothetical protein